MSTTEPLFTLDADDVAITNDDWYTPQWVLDAAGIVFDVDVAAPVLEESRTVPARQHLTILDDGLTTPWEGTVWCNPPYSNAEPWVRKWSEHPDGMILMLAVPQVRWLGLILANAQAFTLLSVDFVRPGRMPGRPRWPSILAARGCGRVFVVPSLARFHERGCEYHP